MEELECRIRSLDDLIYYAKKITNEEAVNVWLDKSLKAFKGRTPRELVEAEDWQRLEIMVYLLMSGEPL